jgi:hypothetical protein
MSVDVDVPKVKWSMLEWKTKKDKPKNDEQVLIYSGEAVVAGRYLHGVFVVRSWHESLQIHPNVVMWASWPKAPKW